MKQTFEEMMEEVSPRRPKPSIGYGDVGNYWRQRQGPHCPPDAWMRIRTDDEYCGVSPAVMPGDQLVLHQLDRLTTWGRMKMALTEGGRPDMANDLKQIQDCWWKPPEHAPDILKLLKDYEREPGSFEFICRAQWVSVQGEPDYEVTDPETGQRHTVTATPFQKEAGYHALVQMMRIAMKS